MSWMLFYLAAVSCLTFLLCGIDKHKAKKGRWRIQERTLLLLAAAGGGWGNPIRRRLLSIHRFLFATPRHGTDP